MKRYLIVKADTNDADYVTAKHPVTLKQIEDLKPIIKAIKKIRGHNWETQDLASDCTPEELYIETKILTESQVELMEEFTPNAEYGIHTIVSIELIEVAKETKLI